MSPNKCNFVIFSNHADKSNNLNIKLFNEDIPRSDIIAFLGIRFDPRLSFHNQIKYLEEQSLKRMNILKILSNKKWKLKTSVLIRIYILLIRSLLDYSSIIYHCLNNENKQKLQKIQNSCLKIIHHKPTFFSTIEIHKLSNLCTLETRFENLNSKFFSRCIVNNNPLIKDLAIEYLNFSGAREIRIATPLCFLKEKIFQLLNLLKPP